MAFSGVVGLKLVYSLLICLFVAAGAYAQSEQTVMPAVEELYLARDDGKGKAGEQVSEFRITDIPIHCVVLLDANSMVTVKMNFVAVSVTGVKPDTKVVTSSYVTKEGQNRVNFTGRPDDRWTPGKYRVDIFLDGKMAKSLEFDIKSAVDVVPGAGKFVPTPRDRKAKPPKPTGKSNP
jgi:hypothetical protein